MAFAVQKLADRPGPGIYYLGDPTGVMIAGNVTDFPAVVLTEPGRYELNYERGREIFGGPEDVVPKASVPTRWSQKITETSHTFRGPDTFSQQELAYEHAHRHSTRGGRIYMPPSQLTIKEGGYVPAKEQRLSRMPAQRRSCGAR